MYIEPFWRGVIATVLVELGLCIVCRVVTSWKNKKRKKK